MKSISKQYIKRDMKKISEEIIKIAENRGLTAENVVESARNKGSSLHRFFEWDDTLAAEEWRLQQARVLIHTIKIKITMDGDLKMIRAFENIKVTIDGDSFREYKPTIEILSNLEYRQQMIIKAIGEVKYWQEKYALFKEFNPIFNKIKETERRVRIKWLKQKKLKKK